ncbi:MAG: hypothetical protein IKM51_00815, partial [Oscillospiraceae bacterium]|nr:hypothetical protein [Oscillospiraceae bacterium]
MLLEFSLMMEGSTVFYWAEEFWPDEPGDQAESLTGKSQEFSSMFGGVDSYEALPMKRSITLTEEGVAIEYDGLGREDYIKDDSLPRPHDSKEAMAEMMSENIAQTVMDETVVGTYTCWDGINSVRLIFDAEGGFEAVQKSFAKPVRIFEGSWGIEDQ